MNFEIFTKFEKIRKNSKMKFEKFEKIRKIENSRMKLEDINLEHYICVLKVPIFID